MWDLISKIIPTPVIVGLLVWGLISAIFLQPLVEERQANITYIPQCKAGKLPQVALRQTPRNKTPDDETETVQPPMAVQIVSELRNIFKRDDEAYTTLRYANMDSCSCSVGVAYERSFWPSLGNVMSFGLFEPRSIKFLEVRVAQIKASGICG
ncbi:hypothetical protein [Roseibium album]|uniref:hypothetical protein n=1 Tax=Roseibium album TaxID=311410 RepID=UPI0032999063